MKINHSTLMLITLYLLTHPSIKAIAQSEGSPSNGAISTSAANDPLQTGILWATGPGANNHEYFLTPMTGSWVDAEAQAVAMGGHLVSINSADEENFLVANFLADSSPVSTKPLWIGLTDANNGIGSENYSTWTSGEAVTYTDWNDSTEPDNLNHSEDYVALNWHYSFGATNVKGTWNDVPLNGTTVDDGGNNARAIGPYYGIVEVVPEPATNRLLSLGTILGLGWLRRRKVGKPI